MIAIIGMSRWEIMWNRSFLSDWGMRWPRAHINALQSCKKKVILGSRWARGISAVSANNLEGLWTSRYN
jgi:hypothetical protein